MNDTTARSQHSDDVDAFLRAKAREIEERLKALSPVVTEYRQLQAALAVLTTPPRRPRGRPETRVSQTFDLVRAQPGITIPEIAGHMGIEPNYLYRVLPQLAVQGKVRRDGKGWHPTQTEFET